jgi:hypothetical protein
MSKRFWGFTLFWTWAAFLVAYLAGYVGPSHAQERARPGVVEASAVVLKDDAGRVRGEFSVRGGQGALVLMDGEGRETFRVLASADGTTTLMFDDAGGTSRLLMGLRRDGEAAIKVGSGNRVGIVASPDGVAGFAISDKRKGEVYSASIDAYGRLERP